MSLRFIFPRKAKMAIVAAMLLSGVAAVAVAETPAEAVHEIKDPYYGDALFELLV